MKKSSLMVLTVLFFFAISPLQTNAGTEIVNNPKTTETGTESARAQELLNRLTEISEMDINAMSRTEKKEIRKEVRAIKKEMKQLDGGIYISVGALIIIILLLIIIL